MKRKCVLLFGALFCTLCMFVTACSNEFAAEDYENNEKISQNDRYSKMMSVFNTMDGGYLLTADKFNGYETLWTKSLKEDTDLEIRKGTKENMQKAFIRNIIQNVNFTI